MTTKKSPIEEFKAKLAAKQVSVTKDAEKKEPEVSLENTVYDVIQDPDKQGRNFVAVKIAYNLKDKTASVVDVTTFEDKAAGMAIQMDKKDRQYLFDKNNRKKEQK